MEVAGPGAPSGSYAGPTYGSEPTFKGSSPFYPKGRITTGATGGPSAALQAVDDIAALNGIPPIGQESLQAVRANAVPGWTSSFNPTSGYITNTHLMTGLTFRYNENTGEVVIDVSNGLFIRPGVRYRGRRSGICSLSSIATFAEKAVTMGCE
jgi:hypothetical protein